MTDTHHRKTRPKNLVDLSIAEVIQSYYTCLSRSATASELDCAVIFSQLITCGASGT